jgi:hypothetical protein
MNLDMMLPPYLSLNTVVDILKLIRDDTCSFQGVGKDVLPERLETLETPQAVVPVHAAPKKRRASKNIELVDLKSLSQYSTEQEPGGLQGYGAG